MSGVNQDGSKWLVNLFVCEIISTLLEKYFTFAWLLSEATLIVAAFTTQSVWSGYYFGVYRCGKELVYL